MLKIVLLFLALYSFGTHAKYSYEFYKYGRETLKSSNIGEYKVKKIELCYSKKKYNLTVDIDCGIDANNYENYFHLSLDAFIKLKKTLKASAIYTYYSLDDSDYCLILVDKKKTYEFEVDISPCVTIYIAVDAIFNDNSKYSVATGIASLTHEDFHILHPPFKKTSHINSLLVNEYAASLITLNSYRILNSALNIPFGGKWNNPLAEQFLQNTNMDKYCADFSSLRKKNIKLGPAFDSVMGGIFAHIFSNNVVKDSTLLSLYISEEINFLLSHNVTEDKLLSRLGLCGKPAVIHENITMALLPTTGMDNELVKLFGYNYPLLSVRTNSQDGIEKLCTDAIYKKHCKTAYIRNFNLSDDRNIKDLYPLGHDKNVKKEFFLNKDFRYIDGDINTIIDTGASSNVFSKEKFPCITDDFKKVKTLYGKDKEIFKCAHNYPIGEIWVKEAQDDNVLSLRSSLKRHGILVFNPLDINIDEYKGDDTPFIYYQGLITFQDEERVNYCFDTGSRFSYLTKRYQERFLFYPWFSGFTELETSEHNGQFYSFMNVAIGSYLYKVRSNIIATVPHCDVIIGADLANAFNFISVDISKLIISRKNKA